MLVLFLVACDLLAPKPDASPADTGAAPAGTSPPEEVSIVATLSACTVDGLWTYEAWTDGPVASATVDAFAMHPTDGWNEAHPVDVVRSTELGADLFRQLDSAVKPIDYVSGVNTPLVCGIDDRSDAMVYALRVYDAEGGLVDCAAWGGEVYAVLDDPAGRRGSVPAVNPVDRSDEISRTTCHVLY
ncbi:MAG: hypothetical protein ACI8PZ_006953 [Myxococcota bacterium]|jgi:hypothetical protein